jgi:negative regulator of flagellin synthesis FlgM
MEIIGKNTSVNLEHYVRNIKDKRKSDAQTGKSPDEIPNDDRVVLSSKAREIQEAKKLMSSVSDIREEKVAQIRKQIQEGTYEINEEKIAGKMLKEALLNELL